MDDRNLIERNYIRRGEGDRSAVSCQLSEIFVDLLRDMWNRFWMNSIGILTVLKGTKVVYKLRNA